MEPEPARQTLMSAVDKLNQRFGRGAVSVALMKTLAQRESPHRNRVPGVRRMPPCGPAPAARIR